MTAWQTDVQRARALLVQKELTLVVIQGERVLESRERGVKPLLALLDSGEALAGAVAADKVVGKAAAFLYLLLGVRTLHAAVISRPAVRVLEAGGVALCYDTVVEGIRNRAGNGPCPMESAVIDVEDAHKALSAIRKKLAEIVK